MKSNHKSEKDIYKIKINSEIIEIKYQKNFTEVKIICPVCGNFKIAEQVIKFYPSLIKYRHRSLINLEKIKKQINKALLNKTVFCMNCSARLYGQ